jgi:hypothetical protein
MHCMYVRVSVWCAGTVQPGSSSKTQASVEVKSNMWFHMPTKFHVIHSLHVTKHESHTIDDPLSENVYVCNNGTLEES